MSQEQKQIFILGPRRLQNELMAAFLVAGTGIRCRTADHLEAALQTGGGFGGRRLILCDCQGMDRKALQALLRSGTGRLASGTFLALFNLDSALDIEREALALGVRGFFYEQDGGDTLLKGVGAIFNNELWISRQRMSRYILEGEPPAFGVGKEETVLTGREREILGLLSLGASNRMIAEKLCISPHTVKTHIYNIFKKIKVKNRFQATRWAARHFPDRHS